MTAEPKSHGRPTKPKERVGRKSFSGCCLELARSDGMRQLPNLEIGASLALSLIIQASTVFGTSRGGRAGLSECFEVDGCWKKVAVCAGEVSRKLKRGAVVPEKRAASIVGGPEVCSPRKILKFGASKTQSGTFWRGKIQFFLTKITLSLGH